MPLLNYTTRIPTGRTVADVSAMLGRNGAQHVLTHYGDEGTATGVTFSLRGPHGIRAYTLPVDIAGVHRALAAERRAGRLPGGPKACSPEQAARVAWRIARDWLDVRLALIEAQMATLDQIMLPYLHVDTDADGTPVTLHQRYAEREQAALTAAEAGERT